MDVQIPKHWKQVSPALFSEFLSVCNDYRGDGWANGIVFFFVHTSEQFGFQVNVAGSAVYFLDPQFLVE